MRLTNTGAANVPRGTFDWIGVFVPRGTFVRVGTRNAPAVPMVIEACLATANQGQFGSHRLRFCAIAKCRARETASGKTGLFFQLRIGVRFNPSSERNHSTQARNTDVSGLERRGQDELHSHCCTPSQRTAQQDIHSLSCNLPRLIPRDRIRDCRLRLCRAYARYSHRGTCACDPSLSACGIAPQGREGPENDPRPDHYPRRCQSAHRL
jgi:hypothetical protein